MIILGLDPGSEKTACVIYHVEPKKVTVSQYLDNVKVPDFIRDHDYCHAVVCEHIQCLGMAVGESVFETCYCIGYFKAFAEYNDLAWHRIYRNEEKMHLCNSMRAKDANIRQALIDKFPATGGGKCPQVGTKKKPGPLFGISGDLWSALAVAVTYAETKL